MSHIERAEFEELRKEVKELRAFVMRFLGATSSEGPGAVTCESIACNSIVLKGNDGRNRGCFGVDNEGPYLTLLGEDQKPRLVLKVNEKVGRIHICGDDLKSTLELWTDDAGHGNLAIYSSGGIPRVGIRGLDDGGVVTLIGSNGTPRAVIHSINDKGEVALFNESHLLAKMSAAEHGGTIGVLDSMGRRACVILAAEKGNSMLVYSPDGEEAITLMASKHGALLCMGANGVEKETESAISLMALSGHGGGIRINNNNGTPAIELDAVDNGGSLSIHSKEGDALIQMSVAEGGGFLSASHINGHGLAHFMAHEHGGTISITGEDRNLVMQVAERTTSFMIMKESHVQAIIGTSGENDYATFMLTNLDNSPAVNLMASAGGGKVTIGGSDGTTQAGLGSTDEGGFIAVYSELGIERATLASKADGGGFKLKWGGTDGLFAVATEAGGCIFINDRNGRTIDTLPGE
ncbi:MAG: hypothetical protein JWL59_1746 [Chthoniobacteraceae bacterium]|nr:hypothetical protein [Chthoniobacteraceae bacterium]